MNLNNQVSTRLLNKAMHYQKAGDQAVANKYAHALVFYLTQCGFTFPYVGAVIPDDLDREITLICNGYHHDAAAAEVQERNARRAERNRIRNNCGEGS